MLLAGIVGIAARCPRPTWVLLQGCLHHRCSLVAAAAAAAGAGGGGGGGSVAASPAA